MTWKPILAQLILIKGALSLFTNLSSVDVEQSQRLPSHISNYKRHLELLLIVDKHYCPLRADRACVNSAYNFVLQSGVPMRALLGIEWYITYDVIHLDDSRIVATSEVAMTGSQIAANLRRLSAYTNQYSSYRKNFAVDIVIFMTRSSGLAPGSKRSFFIDWTGKLCNGIPILILDVCGFVRPDIALLSGVAHLLQVPCGNTLRDALDVNVWSKCVEKHLSQGNQLKCLNLSNCSRPGDPPCWNDYVCTYYEPTHQRVCRYSLDHCDTPEYCQGYQTDTCPADAIRRCPRPTTVSHCVAPSFTYGFVESTSKTATTSQILTTTSTPPPPEDDPSPPIIMIILVIVSVITIVIVCVAVYIRRVRAQQRKEKEESEKPKKVVGEGDIPAKPSPDINIVDHPPPNIPEIPSVRTQDFLVLDRSQTLRIPSQTLQVPGIPTSLTISSLQSYYSTLLVPGCDRSVTASLHSHYSTLETVSDVTPEYTSVSGEAAQEHLYTLPTDIAAKRQVKVTVKKIRKRKQPKQSAVQYPQTAGVIETGEVGAVSDSLTMQMARDEIHSLPMTAQRTLKKTGRKFRTSGTGDEHQVKPVEKKSPKKQSAAQSPQTADVIDTGEVGAVSDSLTMEKATVKQMRKKKQPKQSAVQYPQTAGVIETGEIGAVSDSLTMVMARDEIHSLPMTAQRTLKKTGRKFRTSGTGDEHQVKPVKKKSPTKPDDGEEHQVRPLKKETDGGGEHTDMHVKKRKPKETDDGVEHQVKPVEVETDDVVEHKDKPVKQRKPKKTDDGEDKRVKIRKPKNTDDGEEQQVRPVKETDVGGENDDTRVQKRKPKETDDGVEHQVKPVEVETDDVVEHRDKPVKQRKPKKTDDGEDKRVKKRKPKNTDDCEEQQVRPVKETDVGGENNDTHVMKRKPKETDDGVEHQVKPVEVETDDVVEHKHKPVKKRKPKKTDDDNK